MTGTVWDARSHGCRQRVGFRGFGRILFLLVARWPQNQACGAVLWEFVPPAAMPELGIHMDALGNANPTYGQSTRRFLPTCLCALSSSQAGPTDERRLTKHSHCRPRIPVAYLGHRMRGQTAKAHRGRKDKKLRQVSSGTLHHSDTEIRRAGEQTSPQVARAVGRPGNGRTAADRTLAAVRSAVSFLNISNIRGR